MIFIGHGVTLAEAGKELTEFVQKVFGIPVISSPNGMGCLDITDPLSFGFDGPQLRLSGQRGRPRRC